MLLVRDGGKKRGLLLNERQLIIFKRVYIGIERGCATPPLPLPGHSRRCHRTYARAVSYRAAPQAREEREL